MNIALPRGRTVEVRTLSEAVSVVRTVANTMGYHEFYDRPGVGRVTDDNGLPVADVSYNGRVWSALDGSREIAV